jgi:hypothetical protein
MSDIPQARYLLEQVKHKDPNISKAINLMYRDKVKDIKAPATSRKMTPEIKRTIIRMYKSDPKMSCQKIANILRINIGRVSETIKEYKENIDG